MAGALTTRALVLGVVRLFEPINGYQVTRELMSWDVEAWAKLRPGSVYSMLTTLTKQGAITRHDLAEGQRSVAVYQVSGSGRVEFSELIRSLLDGSRGFDRTALDTGMAFAPYLKRAEVIEALTARIDRLDAVNASVHTKIAEAGLSVPPHVAHMLTLDRDLLRAERNWLADFRDRVEVGFLTFLGEVEQWQPAPEDPGWEMVEQSRRYRDQIEALRR